MHEAGLTKLRDAGIEVVTDKIEQDDLPQGLRDFDGIVVRSATKVRQGLIDQCPRLKFIGRGGVGMDNIDVDYARGKGITVNNTPAASSQSVAELTLAHMFSVARFLHDANRSMPAQGEAEFKKLKKAYGKGRELQGKTLGIVGFGRIGQALASMALGMGMKVVAHRRSMGEQKVNLEIAGHGTLEVNVPILSLDELLASSDYVTLHVPGGAEPLLGEAQIAQMKRGSILINVARGGVVEEEALLAALNAGQIAYAGLDVFVGEPEPQAQVLRHPKLSLSPHIGAATEEAQARIGEEMADCIIACFQSA